MDIGSGVAIAGVGASIAAVMITAIHTKSKTTEVAQKEDHFCPVHATLVENIKDIKIELVKDISEVKQDVKSIQKEVTTLLFIISKKNINDIGL